MSAVAAAPTATERKLPELFEAYLGKLKRRGRKATTVYSVRTALAAFAAYLEEHEIDVEKVDGDVMFDYFEQSSYKDSTKRAHAVKIKAAYAFGLRTKRTEADPFDEDEGYAVPKEVAPDIEEKLIRAEHLRSMRRAVTSDGRVAGNPNTRLLFHLLAYTGFRRNEIRTLEWSDVNWDDETIRLRAVNAKLGKPRMVPIHPELLDILKWRNPERKKKGHILTPTWTRTERTRNGDDRTITVVGGRGSKVEGDPYAEGTAFDRLLASFCPEFGFHSFRKTWTNSLLRAQVQPSVVKEMGGWAAKGTMEFYYESVSPQQMREAILRLYEDVAI